MLWYHPLARGCYAFGVAGGGLERRLQVRARQPRDLPELRVAVVEEWNELPQNNFNRLVRSMRRRCQAVIDARGGNTRY